MPTKKNKKNKTKTLKKKVGGIQKKINEYILKNGDLFEVYANKKKVIELIFANIVSKIKKSNLDFKETLTKDDFIESINTELISFIAGDLINLENKKNKKNKKGLELHKMLIKLTMKNDKPNEERIVNLLMELPLYMLFAFLGYTSYEKHINKTIKENEEEIRKNMKENKKLFGFF
jgi:hypothetical protein